jgi:hypothetical protein
MGTDDCGTNGTACETAFGTTIGAGAGGAAAASAGGAFFGRGTTTFVPHCGHVPLLPAAWSGTWIVTVQYGQLNWMAIEGEVTS